MVPHVCAECRGHGGFSFLSPGLGPWPVEDWAVCPECEGTGETLLAPLGLGEDPAECWESCLDYVNGLNENEDWKSL